MDENEEMKGEQSLGRAPVLKRQLWGCSSLVAAAGAEEKAHSCNLKSMAEAVLVTPSAFPHF